MESTKITWRPILLTQRLHLAWEHPGDSDTRTLNVRVPDREMAFGDTAVWSLLLVCAWSLGSELRPLVRSWSPVGWTLS